MKLRHLSTGMMVTLVLVLFGVWATSAHSMPMDATFDHTPTFTTDGGVQYVVPDDPGDDFPDGCDYYTGNPADPCPRSDDTYLIVKCRGLDRDGDDNAVWHIGRDVSGQVDENGDPVPGSEAFECPNGYNVLDP